MARWKPGSRERLARAALELFAEQGYDSTTVVDITKRAELTERTFYRHFADKRDVLSAGAGEFGEQLVAGVERAPTDLRPIDAIASTFVNAGEVMQKNAAVVRQRQAIVASTPELYERELVKLALATSSLADALRRRGVAEPEATLVAEAGLGAFKTALARWAGNPRLGSLPQVIRDCFRELSRTTGAEASATSVLS